MVTQFADLGTFVDNAFESLPVPWNFFKEQIAEPMGLSSSSIGEYIRNYKLGYILGTHSGDPKQKETRLERLAVFLYGLGASEESQKELISGVGIKASRMGLKFDFPPAEESISLDEIKEAYESVIAAPEDGTEADKIDILYPKFGDAVIRKLDAADFSQNYLAKNLSDNSRLPRGFHYGCITNYREGYFYSTTKNPQDPKSMLERLAVFMFAVGFSEDDKSDATIISELRKKDERFAFPPPLNNRVSYGEVVRDYRKYSHYFEDFNPPVRMK